jgi:DNA-binding transcriptional ArsR family regulator
MASMPTRLARPLGAVLVGVTVFLLTGAVFGVANASGGQATSFVMPGIHLGDKATYRFSETGTTTDANGQETPLNQTGVATVAWATHEPMLQDGQWQDLEALSQTRHRDNQSGPFDQSSGMDDLYVAGTDLLVAFSFHGSDRGQLGQTDTLSPFLRQDANYQAGVELLLFMPSDVRMSVPDCLFGGLLAGKTLVQGDDLALPFCTTEQGLGSGTWTAQGTEAVAGQPALHYRHASSPGPAALLQGAAPGVMDVWLSPASPYPARIHSQTETDEGPATTDMVLTGFEPGTMPRAAGSASPASPEPGWTLQTWSGLVPIADADAGVDFPLTRAVELSKSNKTVSQFLGQHPDAYVNQANSAVTVVQGQPLQQWSFQLAAPGSSLTVMVEEPAAATMGLVPAPVLGALMDGTFRLTVFGPHDDDGYVPRDALPTEMPTAGSMMQRWAWQRPQSGAADTWAFDLRGNGLFELAGAGFAFSAGRWEGSIQPGTAPDPAVTLDSNMTIDMALLDVNGTTHGFELLAGEANNTFGAAALPPPPSAPLTKASSTGPGSWLPSPAEVAGAGLVAVVAGVLYWLWPTLKGAPVLGLFSRVEGSKLLDHPGRARLVEIVQAEPGVHFQDLLRRSGLPNGTAIHHLAKLTRAGLLSARPLGRYTCYFPGSSVDRTALAQAPVLRSEGARLVFGLIQANPGLSGLELAGRTGLQPSTVNYHVQKLVECGLVATVRDGRAVRLRAAAA